MSRKIPVHELASSLASACDISPEYAEDFIRSFFDLVAEGVIAGEIVKVKGIGTFAASGDSLNPVEFTPDKNLANTINAPFAIFEPEPVDASISDEDLENVVVEIPEASAEEPATEETAAESISELTTEPETLSGQEPTEKEPQPETETPEAEEISEDENEPVDESVSAEESEEVTVALPEEIIKEEAVEEIESPVPPIPDVVEETVVVPPPHPDIPEAPVVEKPVAPRPPVFTVEEDQEEHVEYDNDNSGKGGLGFGWGLAIGLIVGLALGACGVYFGINYLYPMPSIEKVETVENEEESMADDILTAIVPTDSVASDSATTDSVASPTVSADTVAKNAPIDTTAPVTTAQTVVKDKIRSGYLLHEMARKHYGSKAFWVYIYEENKAKIGNPNRVGVGLELVIPPAEKYGINPNDPASIKKANEQASKILAKYPN